jgi:hypothetical protein
MRVSNRLLVLNGSHKVCLGRELLTQPSAGTTILECLTWSAITVQPGVFWGEGGGICIFGPEGGSRVLHVCIEHVLTQ